MQLNKRNKVCDVHTGAIRVVTKLCYSQAMSQRLSCSKSPGNVPPGTHIVTASPSQVNLTTADSALAPRTPVCQHPGDETGPFLWVCRGGPPGSSGMLWPHCQRVASASPKWCALRNLLGSPGLTWDIWDCQPLPASLLMPTSAICQNNSGIPPSLGTGLHFFPGF